MEGSAFRLRYAEFVRNVQLIDVFLRESAGGLHLDASLLRRATPLPFEPDVKWDLSEPHLEENGVMDGTGTLNISVFVRHLNRRRKGFAYRASWTARYQVGEPMRMQWPNMDAALQNQILETFRQSNVPVNIWPFMRAELYRFSSLCGIPPIVLGVWIRA